MCVLFSLIFMHFNPQRIQHKTKVIKSRMERLSDSLLVVFKLVNLNDRNSLRLVNSRLKALRDTIPITKLIVFEKLSVETGKLLYTKEAYGYEHTINCFDLQEPFTSPTLLKQMRCLRSPSAALACRPLDSI